MQFAVPRKDPVRLTSIAVTHPPSLVFAFAQTAPRLPPKREECILTIRSQQTVGGSRRTSRRIIGRALSSTRMCATTPPWLPTSWPASKSAACGCPSRRTRPGRRRACARWAAPHAGGTRGVVDTVPVYVRPASDGDEKAQVVERVAEQIVETTSVRRSPTLSGSRAFSRCSTPGCRPPRSPRFTGLVAVFGQPAMVCGSRGTGAGRPTCLTGLVSLSWRIATGPPFRQEFGATARLHDVSSRRRVGA